MICMAKNRLLNGEEIRRDSSVDPPDLTSASVSYDFVGPEIMGERMREIASLVDRLSLEAWERGYLAGVEAERRQLALHAADRQRQVAEAIAAF